MTLRLSLRTLRNRTFFASSTDHTKLLQEAQVHRLDERGGMKRYVMAAEGMDLETVKKVPQLHLARLDRKDAIIFGAKVINRTLGTPVEVCGRLVDAAIQDINSDSGGAQARGTLHGLSAWVIKGIEKKVPIQTLVDLPPSELQAVELIAHGEAGADAYDAGRLSWEKLVREFLDADLGSEAALYRSKGGKLVAVEHHADVSEYADTSAGSMAVFSF
jgi:hypothetical protein